MSDYWDDLWYDGPDDHTDYEEAEYHERGYSRVPHGSRPPAHCRKHCGQEVIWKQDTAGLWFLADAETGLPHDCEDDPDTLL